MEKDALGALPTIPNEIINPPPFDPSWFNYSEVFKRPIDPKYSYLMNIDVRQLYETYGTEPPGLSEVEKNPSKRPERAILIMLKDYVREARAFYIPAMLMMCFEATSSVNPEYQCCITESIPLYVMSLLLKDYPEFPFYERSDGMFFLKKYKQSSMLPTLCYILLILHTQYILGNGTQEIFRICCTVWLDWARTSLNQEHLANKSYYMDTFKLINDKVKDCTMIAYSENGVPQGLIKDDNPKEIWYEGEREKLENDLAKTHPEFQKWFNKHRKRGFKNVSELVDAKMHAYMVANTGNFKNAPAILGLKKSVDPRTEHPLAHPKVKAYLDNTYVLEYDYSSIPELDGMWTEFLYIIETIRDQIANIDVFVEFLEKITNKSAGVKLDPEILTKEGLNPEFKKYTSKRLISFLLTMQQFYDEETFFMMLIIIALAAIRKQNFRRVRVVEVVSNAVQAIAVIPLLMMEIIGDIADDLAYGKQRGDAKDMTMQLAASSKRNTYLSSLDVSGMDASTQRTLFNMLFYMACEAFKGTKMSSYFCFQEYEGLVNRNGVVTRERINPITLAIIKSLPAINDSYNQLRDGVMGETTKISGQGYPSGMFSTNAQHNAMLLTKSRDTDKKFRKIKKRTIRIKRQSSGDDMIIEKESEDPEVINEHSAFEIEELAKIGFKTERKDSAYSGNFLQQEVSHGQIVPLHMRTSPLVSERGDTIMRDILTKMKEFFNVCTELASRSRYPENIQSIWAAMWNVSRTAVYKIDMFMDPSLWKKVLAKINKNEDLNRWIYLEQGKMIVQYPYVTLFHSEGVSAPLPPIKTMYGSRMGTSYMQPQGDIAEILLREMYSPDQDDLSNPKIVELRSQAVKKMLRRSRNKLQLNNLSVADQAVYIPSYALLDKSLLRLHGWTFGQFLCRVDFKEQLKKKRTDTVGDETIFLMTSKLRMKQDQGMLQASRDAHVELASEGIDVPHSILYYKSAQRRVEDSLMEVEETDAEYKFLSTYFLTKLLEYDGVYQRSAREGMFSVSVFKVPSIPRVISQDAQLNRITSYMPGCRPGTQTCNLLLCTKTVFSGSNFGARAFAKFASKKYRGLQIEEIVAGGVKVYINNPNRLPTFYIAIQLPKHLIHEVQNLIIEEAESGLASLKGILPPRRTWLLSSNPSDYSGSIARTSTYNSRKRDRIELFALVVAMYWLLSFGHEVEHRISVVVRNETLRTIVYGPKITQALDAD